MKFFFIPFFVLKTISSLAQAGEPHLIINSVATNIKRNTITLNCSLVNGCNKMRFYKASSNDDFCHRIIYLELTDLYNKSKSGYFPCTWVSDMKALDINNTNSVELNPNSVYQFKIIMNNSKFNNIKFKHIYDINLSINYRYICGERPCNVFTGFLEAKKYRFLYR